MNLPAPVLVPLCVVCEKPPSVNCRDHYIEEVARLTRQIAEAVKQEREAIAEEARGRSRRYFVAAGQVSLSAEADARAKARAYRDMADWIEKRGGK